MLNVWQIFNNICAFLIRLWRSKLYFKLLQCAILLGLASPFEKSFENTSTHRWKCQLLQTNEQMNHHGLDRNINYNMRCDILKVINWSWQIVVVVFFFFNCVFLCETIAELTDGKHEYARLNAARWHISKRKWKTTWWCDSQNETNNSRRKTNLWEKQIHDKLLTR